MVYFHVQDRSSLGPLIHQTNEAFNFNYSVFAVLFLLFVHLFSSLCFIDALLMLHVKFELMTRHKRKIFFPWVLMAHYKQKQQKQYVWRRIKQKTRQLNPIKFYLSAVVSRLGDGLRAELRPLWIPLRFEMHWLNR